MGKVPCRHRRQLERQDQKHVPSRWLHVILLVKDVQEILRARGGTPHVFRFLRLNGSKVKLVAMRQESVSPAWNNVALFKHHGFARPNKSVGLVPS